MQGRTKRRPGSQPYDKAVGMKVGSIAGALATALIVVTAGLWPGLLVIGAVAGGALGWAYARREELHDR